jgi:regulator of sirC expression with transglutaminase-like and TPR domain
VTPLRDRFASLVADRPRCDLGRAALAIACIAYPDLDPDPYLRRLDQLADAVRGPLVSGSGAGATAEAVAAHLFGECGFRGNADDYYDPRNSFLNDVLDRRTGIPISLAVVVMEVSARLGVSVEGVGFPGHFLVRMPSHSGPVLLDPFFGRPVETDELLARLRTLAAAAPGRPEVTEVPAQLLAPADTPAILARMLRNLLQIYRERGDAEHALAAVDLMLVLTPDGTDELRIRADLYERLECWTAARDDLRRCLAAVPRAPDAQWMRARLARLERLALRTH